jgi:hypothetical protein
MTKTKQIVDLVQLVLVTRPLADAWISKSKGNPALKVELVAELWQAMRQGSWDPYRSPIRLGYDGQLLDGHHRLHAAYLHGDPILMMVSKQLLMQSFDGLDREQSQQIGARR